MAHCWTLGKIDQHACSPNAAAHLIQSLVKVIYHRETHACLAYVCLGACPQIMENMYKLKCNLLGISAAQLETSGVCILTIIIESLVNYIGT